MAFYNTTLSQSLSDRFYKYSEIREIYRNQTNQVHGFGYNDVGQLGTNNVSITDVPLSTPVTIPANWIQIATGGYSYSIGIRSDGTLWSWGFNSEGELGQNNLIHRSSPTQIGTSRWSQIVAANYHNLAIRSDGTLWGWGGNDCGQLGQNNIDNRSSPVQIGTDNSWVMISANANSSFALRNDGALFAWGLNASGQLGLNDIIDRSSPVQVGTSSWSMVNTGGTTTYAIRSDNTLWGWGLNDGWQVGDTTQTYRSSPVQLTADNGVVSFTQIAGGDKHGLALDNKGWLYAWGSNNVGCLGLGSVGPGMTYRSRPTLISTNAGFSKVFAVNFNSAGLKADGTVWWWGSSSGYSSPSYRSSPVQLSSTRYRTLSLQAYHMLAIKE